MRLKSLSNKNVQSEESADDSFYYDALDEIDA